MKPEDRKRQYTVRLSPDIINFLKGQRNASKFIDAAIRAMMGKKVADVKICGKMGTT